MAEFRDPTDAEQSLITLFNELGRAVVGIAGDYYLVKGRWEPPTPAAPRVQLRGIKIDQRFTTALAHANHAAGGLASAATALSQLFEDTPPRTREFSPDHRWVVYAP